MFVVFAGFKLLNNDCKNKSGRRLAKELIDSSPLLSPPVKISNKLLKPPFLLFPPVNKCKMLLNPSDSFPPPRLLNKLRMVLNPPDLESLPPKLLINFITLPKIFEVPPLLSPLLTIERRLLIPVF